MKYLLVAMKDELTGFTGIQAEQSKQTALRNFAYAINNTAQLSQNVKDYSLYELGDYDSKLGKIENVRCEKIADASSILYKEK